ncbi:MAG: DUF418 domain-containing protein [Pseudomonadota bacterium]
MDSSAAGVSAKHQCAPLRDGARLDCLDVLRGFAVLAIFIVNVKMMANGFNHYHDVTQWEGEAAQIIGLLHSRLVHGKFVTIFTALFGAGIALLLAREIPVPRRIVLRRLAWLAVFGGLHLIFLREGDILIWYALTGFLAVPFARSSVPTLVVTGLLLQVAAYTVYVVFPFSVTDAPLLWRLTPNAHEGVASIMLGSPGGMIAARLEAARYYMIDLFLLGGVWIDTLGLMLLGMALLKTGFLGGRQPLKSYLIWGALGLAIASSYYVLRPYLDADTPVQGLVLGVARYAHRFGGALAWSSLIIGLVILGWNGSGFAAVGRTAFTVYILQSVIGLLLFSSLGLGLFGQWSLPVLMIVTLLVWVGFLIVAPLWLRIFRFGPLEWIWRSLTYGEWQPLLRRHT